MDSEVMIESENNPELLTKTTPILKSIENKDVENRTKCQQKEEKKGVFNRQWLLDPQLGSFLQEYKLDSTEALSIACNEPFLIHYGGKK